MGSNFSTCANCCTSRSRDGEIADPELKAAFDRAVSPHPDIAGIAASSHYDTKKAAVVCDVELTVSCPKSPRDDQGRASKAHDSDLPCVWIYQPVNGLNTRIRSEPRINAPKTDHQMHPGDTFGVSEVKDGGDGVLYLRLMDGRGWLFNNKPGEGLMCSKIQATLPPPTVSKPFTPQKKREVAAPLTTNNQLSPPEKVPTFSSPADSSFASDRSFASPESSFTSEGMPTPNKARTLNGKDMFERRKEARQKTEKLESDRNAAKAIGSDEKVSQLAVPIQRFKDGSANKFRVSGLTEEDALKVGLRGLDAEWPTDDLLTFAKRADGCPQLIREKLIEGMLTGTVDLKSMTSGDVSAMQGDMKNLTLSQLLRLRTVNADFAARGEVFETHANLLMKMDGILFERLGRLAIRDDPQLSLPNDAAARRLGMDVTLLAATSKSFPHEWWVCWIGNRRVFFNAHGFACSSTFPSQGPGVADVIDSSKIDGRSGHKRVDLKIITVGKESELTSTPRVQLSAKDSAAAGYGAVDGSFTMNALTLQSSIKGLRPTSSPRD